MAEKSVKWRSTQHHFNCDNVSQQIQVEKQHFKCIINLNTTVCTNMLKHKKKCGRKHRSKHSKEGHKNKKAHKKEHRKSEAPQWNEANRNNRVHKKDELKKNGHRNKYANDAQQPEPDGSATKRITPNCTREACRVHHEHRKENFRRHNVWIQRNHHREWKERSLSEDKVNLKTQKALNHRHHHNKRRHFIKKIKQTESRILLSPISSSPLKDSNDNLTYEDISSASLEYNVKEKPPTKRYHKPPKWFNHRQHKHREEMKESKLDTLIRRTKERERRLVEQSRRDQEQWFTSTPIRNEYSSVDFPMSCSDVDISMNSLSTLVIDTNKLNNAYSPSWPLEVMQTSIDDFQSSKPEKLSYRRYSPSSPTRSFSTKVNVPKETHKLLNIKIEPTMDIAAYSPTSTHKVDRDGVKRETVVKSEPLFSCAISPIYFENETDDTGMVFCKMESVKGEVFDDYLG